VANPSRAVILDRDGVLIVDTGYPSSAEEIRICPGAAEAVRALCDAGFVIGVASNQSGVARGIVRRTAVFDIQREISRVIELGGGRISAFAYCFHLPDAGCPCRKPGVGMLDTLRTNLGFATEHSWMVGDRRSDILFGKNGGLRTVMIGTERNDADFLARDVKHAAEAILGARR
jgi:D-glycero-D-manno-heptose 1,7-bisphosphate phosphatase